MHLAAPRPLIDGGSCVIIINQLHLSLLHLRLSVWDPPRDAKSISRFPAILHRASRILIGRSPICIRAVSTAARNYRTAIQCVPRKRAIVSTGFFRRHRGIRD